VIKLDTFLDRLKKQMARINIVSVCWKKCSFAEKYDVKDMTVAKGNLMLYVDSGIAKRDMEINAVTILKELNSKLPSRKSLKSIEIKVRGK